MLWEELSAKRFPDCIKESEGVCVLPLGVLEKHGNHLPVGTDMYTATAVCKKAAELESAIVFPYYFFGQIAEARHYTGTIAASHRLIMDTLLEMCDEIHRNGFHKIVIASSHGGNNYFLPFFAQEMPRLNREYNVYICSVTQLTKAQRQKVCDMAKTEDLGYHAGLTETSLIMHLRPDLVFMEDQDIQEGRSLGRLKDLNEAGVFTGFNWYANYPFHVAGDPSPATAELGSTIFDMISENVAGIIRAVKADDMSGKLVREFNLAGEKPL